jgi:hypothetical protein
MAAMRCDGSVKHLGRVAWITAVIAVVAVVLLLTVTAKKDDDFWRTAVPGYLTGIGTLALATLTFFLLREGVAERQALADTQAQRDREDALREARKVITTFETVPGLVERGPGTAPINVDRYVIRVLNAGTEPIVGVRLLDAGSREAAPQHLSWIWEPGGAADAFDVAVLLSGMHHDFPGRWITHWGFAEDVDPATVPTPPMGTPSAEALPFLQAMIGWTDSRGRQWMRIGTNLPVHAILSLDEA